MSAPETTGPASLPPRRRPVSPALHARAKELFGRAAELDAGGRTALLARECAADPELRAEIESLLAHHVPGTLVQERTVSLAPAAQRTGDARAGGSRDGGAGASPASTALPAALEAPVAMDGRGSVLRKRAPGRAPIVRRVRLIGLVLLLAVPLAGAFWVKRGVERALSSQLQGQLLARRDSSVRALTVWMSGETSLAREWADDPRVRESSAELLALAEEQRGDDPSAALVASPAGASLAALLAPVARRGGHRAFGLLDRGGLLLACSLPESQTEPLQPGLRLSEAGRTELAQAFEGRCWVRMPYRLGAFRDAFAGPESEAVMAVIAPVRAADGTVIAALAFLLHADVEFGSLLASARVGQSGETFAFDHEGRLLSESRHAVQLAAAGLLPTAQGATPTLLFPLRDPGVDLVTGARATGPPASWPLTLMAASATAGHDGVNVAGYRDYRGVTVVGAWAWLAEPGFGVATEIDADEAYAALAAPRAAPALLAIAFAVLLGALALTLRAVLRLRRDVAAARELGQYTLQELLGEGGTGQVWRARHALLARPAAVKVLRPDALGRDALARFEREMQATARLSHPNTVEIYDSGRTEDGQFYYAMECLDGISLQRLATAHGAQEPRRVVHLLRQVCASLAEAHAAGLVHRDVKPGNLMLCRRAGELDVIKVLDFGLVKDLSAPAGDATAMLGLAGTPAYMSPERLRPGAAVDARCDVWAVGAVAFRLLTGRDLWSGSLGEILAQIVTLDPPHAAAFAPGPLPEGLDRLVSDCLQRDPAFRPADAAALLARLDALHVPPWTQGDARDWWARNVPAAPALPAPDSAQAAARTAASA